MTAEKAVTRALPGFEAVRRYRNHKGELIAKLLPGDYYVTCQEEVLDTVLGSCVSACIRNPRLMIGGMNHFMLPRPSGSGSPTGSISTPSPARADVNCSSIPRAQATTARVTPAA